MSGQPVGLIGGQEKRESRILPDGYAEEKSAAFGCAIAAAGGAGNVR
jgi:hypothetical protein